MYSLKFFVLQQYSIPTFIHSLWQVHFHSKKTLNSTKFSYCQRRDAGSYRSQGAVCGSYTARRTTWLVDV
jgi:hypothetical protein